MREKPESFVITLPRPVDEDGNETDYAGRKDRSGRSGYPSRMGKFPLKVTGYSFFENANGKGVAFRLQTVNDPLKRDNGFAWPMFVSLEGSSRSGRPYAQTQLYPFMELCGYKKEFINAISGTEADLVPLFDKMVGNTVFGQPKVGFKADKYGAPQLEVDVYSLMSKEKFDEYVESSAFEDELDQRIVDHIKGDSSSEDNEKSTDEGNDVIDESKVEGLPF